MKTLLLRLIIICSIFFVLYSSPVNAQNEKFVDSKGNFVPAELLLKITVKFNNTSFIDAIHEISNKGNFHLNYSENIIPAGKKISFSAEDRPAFEILQNILKGTGLDIIVINPSQIVLTKVSQTTSQNSQSKFTINGYVMDAANGEALIEANIYIPEINSGTTTNRYGFYSITLPGGCLYFTIQLCWIRDGGNIFRFEFRHNTKH